MSIRKEIIDDLVAHLRNMSEGTGYNFDWQYVTAHIESGEAPGYPAIALEREEEDVDWSSHPRFIRVLPITIHAVAATEHTDEEDPDETGAWMIEDIERAVMVDHTRGDNAHDTAVVANDDYPTEPGWVYAYVRIEVKYQTHIRDPRSIT